MSVLLTVIGSSPAWPNPGSAHSGYLLKENGRRLLLDCGPGVLGRLRERNLIDVDAVVISHFHLDHWGDLVPWAWLAARGFGPSRKPALLLPPGGLAELAAFAERFGHPGMFEGAFVPDEYAPRTAVDAGGFTIEAFPVEHYGVTAFGLQVRGASGRVLAYSGDSGPCPGLRALAEGADLFLCEATLALGSDDATPRGHLAADEALGIAEGPTLLTHRPVELPEPDGAHVAVDWLDVDV